MRRLLATLTLACLSLAGHAQTPPAYDAAQAKAWGANDQGLRKYVFVLLKTGPKPMPAGPERDAMFKGHFANMGRLAAEGVLAYAGPFDGVDGWRGLFIMTVPDIATAKLHTETDPVIQSGEMVAEYHLHFGSAALVGVPEAHKRIVKPMP
ncbi:YciI family protein [Roseateles paludis]|jgi:uncharacterized protein YciI|uniref:YciI family protein n=1 Tax=Roseateles paludis TaxID=3145238 RepID=A0ABV0FW33_9BURK